MGHTLDWLVLWVLLLPLVEFLQPLQDYLVLLSSMLYSKSVQDYNIYSRDTIPFSTYVFLWAQMIISSCYLFIPIKFGILPYLWSELLIFYSNIDYFNFERVPILLLKINRINIYICRKSDFKSVKSKIYDSNYIIY